MWTVEEAKDGFTALVDAALAGTPQFVTRDGVAAVVVLSAEDHARLATGQRPSDGPSGESFVDHLLAFPVGDGSGLDRPSRT